MSSDNFYPANLKELAKDFDQKRKINKAALNQILSCLETGCRISPGGKVLDIGCGSGRFLSPLALRNPKVDFIGLDISSEMLSVLGQKVVGKGLDNLKIVEFDANKRLLFPDEEFDAVLLYHSLHLIKKRKILAMEIKRITKTNGRLMVATTSHSQLSTMWNYKYFPEMLKKEFIRTPDLEEVISLFRNQGFDLIKIKEIGLRKKFRNLKQWSDFLNGKPISALTFFGEKELNILLERVYRNLVKTFGDFSLDYLFDYHTQLYFEKHG